MSVLVGNSRIVLSVLGVNATFTPPGTDTRFVNSASELIHFQICVNSAGNPTLYINCGQGVTSAMVVPDFDSLNLQKVFLSDDPASVSNIFTVHGCVVKNVKTYNSF